RRSAAAAGRPGADPADQHPARAEPPDQHATGTATDPPGTATAADGAAGRPGTAPGAGTAAAADAGPGTGAYPQPVVPGADRAHHDPGTGGGRGAVRGADHPGSLLALAVHRRRDPGRGRRDPRVRLATRHAVRRVDPDGLVPGHLRHRPPGHRPGRAEAAMVVDQAAARYRRTCARSLG